MTEGAEGERERQRPMGRWRAVCTLVVADWSVIFPMDFLIQGPLE